MVRSVAISQEMSTLNAGSGMDVRNVSDSALNSLISPCLPKITAATFGSTSYLFSVQPIHMFMAKRGHQMSEQGSPTFF